MRRALLATFLAAFFVVASSAHGQADPVLRAGLEEARAAEDLAALRVRYGERHPAVLAAQARLEPLAGAARRARARHPAAFCEGIEARVAVLLAQRTANAARFGPAHPDQRALDQRLEALGPFRCVGS